ncbi:MAG: hypothetical protein IJN90_00080 [Bacilli bacterium]|nr:hypothetical protein [Bacilli bacterium]
MKKVLKILLVILILIALLIGGFFLVKKVFSNKPDEKEPVVVELKKLDEIKGYDYLLYDNSTELYKELFNELKTNLESTEMDEAKYAETISKMFVAEFYTLSTKVTNQDVGGIDFIYSGIRDNFKLKASDTIYKYIESNVYGDREQKLPEVLEIVSCSSTVGKYSYKDDDNKININDEKSYVVKLTWNYKEDLGYQTSATIRLVHEKNILTIVSID